MVLSHFHPDHCLDLLALAFALIAAAGVARVALPWIDPARYADSLLLAGALWAQVHGLATLWATGAFQGPIPHASLDDALTTTLELVRDDRQGDPV